MTKEFEQIKNILEPYNQEIQTRQQNEDLERERNEKESWKEFHDGIKNDKSFLDRSGVKSIFEKIRDNGLVKANIEPVYKTVPVYKEKFFGGQTLDHNESKKISDFTPAVIHESDNFARSLLNMRDKRTVYISLIFDILEGGSDGVGGSSSEVRIIAENEKLYLHKKGEGRFEYVNIPIDEGKLGEVIAEAIKNPLRWG